MHIFPTPVNSAQNFKMFSLHCISEILFAKSLDTGLIIRAKIFLYAPKLIHSTSSTDGETDERTTVRRQ